MGLCVSCESTAVATTVKVILEDGSLKEYSYPVKVSYLLSKDSTFICDSDDMDFNDVVSAVNHDQELQPGHLYFVLPLANLSRPLTPQEMAALAVKANAALLKTGRAEKCGGVTFFGTDTSVIKVTDNGCTRSRNRTNGPNRTLASKLTAIRE